MFGLFNFTFTQVIFVLMILIMREFIFHQFALSLLSNHFDAVSRSNLLFLRELVERSNCQKVRSQGIDNSLRFFFEYVAHEPSVKRLCCPSLSNFRHLSIVWLWCLLFLPYSIIGSSPSPIKSYCQKKKKHSNLRDALWQNFYTYLCNKNMQNRT